MSIEDFVEQRQTSRTGALRAVCIPEDKQIPEQSSYLQLYHSRGVSKLLWSSKYFRIREPHRISPMYLCVCLLTTLYKCENHFFLEDRTKTSHWLHLAHGQSLLIIFPH